MGDFVIDVFGHQGYCHLVREFVVRDFVMEDYVTEGIKLWGIMSLSGSSAGDFVIT